MRATLAIAIGAADESELERRVEMCRRAFGEIRLHRPLGDQLQLFAQHLPGSVQLLNPRERVEHRQEPHRREPLKVARGPDGRELPALLFVAVEFEDSLVVELH